MRKLYTATLILFLSSAFLLGATVTGLKQILFYGDARFNSTYSPRELIIDKNTRALPIIDFNHHEIHDGTAFATGYYSVDLDAASTLDLVIITPDTAEYSHLFWKVRSTLVTTLEIHEGITTQAPNNDGTPIVRLNRDRNSATVASVTAFHTPSILGAGTTIFSDSWGISTGGQVRVGGESNSTDEIILKRNTKYMFRVISGTNDNRVSITLYWYQHTNYS